MVDLEYKWNQVLIQNVVFFSYRCHKQAQRRLNNKANVFCHSSSLMFSENEKAPEPL